MIHYTPNYNFKTPDNSERASQIPFNDNFYSLDTLLAECALKTELTTTNNSLASLESTVNSNYSTFLNFKNYVEGNYYTSTSIDDLLKGYAKSTDLDAYAKSTDLDAYAKSTDLDDYVTITNFNANIASIASVYVAKTELNTTLNSYVKQESLNTTLNSYATKTDLNSYATTDTVSALEIRVKAIEDAWGFGTF